MEDRIKKYLNIPKNNFVIFLFHGVIEKNLFEIRNYTKKHIGDHPLKPFFRASGL